MIGLLLAVATAAPAPAADALVPYRVRRGDTLPGLARAYLLPGHTYGEIRQLNGAVDPGHLQPGETLLIPTQWLRVVPIAARIEAFRGRVTLDGRRLARIGALLREGMRVSTGVNASVSFRLADKSTVTLPSLSTIRVVRLRRTLLTGQVERAFMLEAGRSDAEVRPSRGGRDPFEIRTPVSVAAVRGTQFRVSVEQGGKAATTSVVEGKVGVQGTGGEALVPAEYGLASTLQSTGRPVPLLAPPDIEQPVHVETDGTQVFTIDPPGGAARYRLQIADDDEFHDMRKEVTQASPVFRLPPLPAGTYIVRATALDAKDVEGLPSTVYRYTYRTQRGVVPARGAAQAAGASAGVGR